MGGKLHRGNIGGGGGGEAALAKAGQGDQMPLGE